MKTVYKLSDIKNLKLSTNDLEKIQNDVKSNTKLLDEVQAVHPSEMFLTFTCDDSKNLHYQYLEVFLINDKGEKTVKVKYYQNRYSFFNPLYHNYKNLTRWDIEKIEAKRQKPNNIGIGKLTNKKLMAWVDYLQFEIEEMEALNKTNVQVGEDYRKKIAPYNPTYYSYNNNKGEVRINNLVLEFEICESFVSEKIKVDCTANFENFLKLSDNGFKAS